MEERRPIIDLTVYINKSHKENMDTVIAKAILKNRNQLQDLSLEQLADRAFVSQPTLTRFIQKMGYKNYNQFRQAAILDLYRIEKENLLADHCSTAELRQEVYESISTALESVFDLNLELFEEIIRKMKSYENIVIWGSELSAAIAFKIQMALIALGKNAINCFDINYQKEILPKMNEDTLLICISIEGRWFSHLNIDNLASCKAYKMLWTLEPDHSERENFDFVYTFGKEVSSDLGYNELMYFVLLVYRCLLQK